MVEKFDSIESLKNAVESNGLPCYKVKGSFHEGIEVVVPMELLEAPSCIVDATQGLYEDWKLRNIKPTPTGLKVVLTFVG